MTDNGRDAIIADLARAGVGPRMSARILGLSVAWVCVVRRRLDIKHRDPSVDDIVRDLPPDLRSRVVAYRDWHKRSIYSR